MAEQYDVFMSYSRTDAEVMRHVSDDLRKHSFIVWNDEALEPGTPSWKDAIEAAIEGSKTVVALLSPDAKKSEWIERELDYARAQNVPIIPVIVRGETQNAVPFELITVQRADIRKDYDDGYYQLQDALAEHLKRPDLRPPARTRPVQELQAQKQGAAAKVVAGKQISFDNQLRVWNPVSYMRLLWLYFFNADGLQKVDPTSTRAVAVWLASTLLWLPVGINAVLFRLSEIPLWGIDKPFLIVPAWIIPLGWLLTGLIGQARFDVRSGMRAFLRGPMRMVSVIMGIGAALLYAGSLNFGQPPLAVHDGLAYLTLSSAQQLLMIAGGLSVFVGMILANNLAQGFASWLGVWFSAGCVGLFALLFYVPIGERVLRGFQSDGTASASDVTASGIFSFAGVVCVLGMLLVITVGAIAGAQRQRNVSGFNFFVLLMLVAAYGLLVWGHVAQ
jgi:hypothetical protein